MTLLTTKTTEDIEPRTVTSPCLGEVQFTEDDIILFPGGLIGFEEFINFTILSPPELVPFRWLLCIDAPELCLPVVDPGFVMDHYDPRPPLEEMRSIGIFDVQQAQFFAIVTVGKEVSQMSVNLRGPIVINEKRKLGKQVVLVDSDYRLKHPIVLQTEKQS